MRSNIKMIRKFSHFYQHIFRVQYYFTRFTFDISHGQSLMFNTKFTYMYIFDITEDFDLFKIYVCTEITMMIANAIGMVQTWLLLMVYLCSLSWHWLSTATKKKYMGWSQLKLIALFKVCSMGWLVGFYTRLDLALCNTLLRVMLCRARSWSQWSWCVPSTSFCDSPIVSC